MNFPRMAKHVRVQALRAEIKDLTEEVEWLRGQNQKLRLAMAEIQRMVGQITEITDGGCTATFSVGRQPVEDEDGSV